MGEMVMKNLFDRENFISSTYNYKQLRQSRIVNLGIALFFITSSISFIYFGFALTEVGGAIISGSIDVAFKDLMRAVPLIMCFLMSLWSLLLAHAYYRNVNEEKRIKSIKKNAITILAFCGFNALYIIIGRIAKLYLSIVEGGPSALYPLNTIFYSFFFILFGVAMLYLVGYIKKTNPYLVPTRGPIVTKARWLYCIGVTLWMLVALFGFSIGIMSCFIYDFMHGHVFYGLATILMYLVPFAFIVVWEFYYNNLKEEKRAECLLPISLIGIGVSIISITLYFVSLSLDLDAPSNAGYGMFPIGFAANSNILILLVVFTPLIISVIALIKAIIMRRKAK